MVAGPDGAELARRLLAILLAVGGLPGVGVVEQLVLDALGVRAGDLNEIVVATSLMIVPTRSWIAENGVSRRIAMLPQPMSKPTPEMLIWPS